MTDKPPSFTPADVRRALKAVESGDRKVCAVDFPAHGGFRLLIGDPSGPVADLAGPNEWDEVATRQ